MSTAAIGIDLGTTFSVVAHLDALGRPCTIVNAEGDALTPSVVLFDQSSIVVGKEAVKAAALEPERIADFAKRDMGCTYYCRNVAGKKLPPEVIQSLILEKVKRDAELKLGPIPQAVITVPAFFNEPRRKATQDAGKLAGLEVLDIINEPTAAAIAFGYQVGFLNPAGAARRAERILVYDLGGGTFDVTLMEIDHNNFTAVATGGDVFLGGTDWDRRLVDHVAEEFQARHHGDPRKDPAGMQRLLREAEDTKRALSARNQATLSVDHAGHGLRVNVTREEFESLTVDLLERTRFTVRSVMKDAGMAWKDITRVLLVGGSTRMPMVQRMLEQESGLPADRSVSADEAVAHGAAIYAGLLLTARAGHAPKLRIQNVNSHSLGVLAKEPQTGRPRNSVIIPRNTVLPVTRGKQFRTHKANQRSVEIKVIEGGDGTGKNSTPIGRCMIRDLPKDLPAKTLVEVFFTYAENGRLTVQARLPGADRQATTTIERSSGLTDAMLQEWDHRLRRQVELTE